MEHIMYNIEGLSIKESQLKYMIKRLEKIMNEFIGTRNSLDNDIVGRNYIYRELIEIKNDINDITENTYNITSFIGNAVGKYNECELKLKNELNDTLSQEHREELFDYSKDTNEKLGETIENYEVKFYKIQSILSQVPELKERLYGRPFTNEYLISQILEYIFCKEVNDEVTGKLKASIISELDDIGIDVFNSHYLDNELITSSTSTYIKKFVENCKKKNNNIKGFKLEGYTDGNNNSIPINVEIDTDSEVNVSKGTGRYESIYKGYETKLNFKLNSDEIILNTVVFSDRNELISVKITEVSSVEAWSVNGGAANTFKFGWDWAADIITNIPNPITVVGGGAMQLFSMGVDNFSEPNKWNNVKNGDYKIEVITYANTRYSRPKTMSYYLDSRNLKSYDGKGTFTVSNTY